MNLARRWIDLALCATAIVMGASCADELMKSARSITDLNDEGESAIRSEAVRVSDAIGSGGGQSAMDAGPAVQVPLPSPDASTVTAAATPTSGITCDDRIAPTSEAVQQLLQRSCGLSRSCHAGASPQAGLDLSSLDGIFATAVNRPALQNAAMLLIAEGNPDKSYILHKIDNAQAVGTAMPPPPSAALCEAKRSAIEGWIRAGAPR
jgi:hypothetical protein